VSESWKLSRILDGARLSEARRGAIEGLLRALEEDVARAYRESERSRADAARLVQEVRDLRIHLRDRDAHIRNLEAQLFPLIRANPEPEATQEIL
jgi:hypothetical protein